jgi:hypothetical protein
MRKKHGSVPKIHTCSGPDSHNEQNTSIQGAITNETPVPPPQVRTTPHDWGACGATEDRRTARRLQQQLWSQDGRGHRKALVRVPARGTRTRHQSQRAGRSKAHRQVLAPVLATKTRKRVECCILAGQQQFAFPGMAGGRLLRRARGWLPPPEAGRGGGQPTRAGGRAPACLALRPSKDGKHP